MIKLTVIIPFYNSELYLKEAIESVIEQSYQPIEIITVDDGSCDRSAEIAKSFSDVRYLKQENKGPAAARNLGLKSVTSEFVGFHDADDICEKNRFFEQMDLIQKNKNLEIVYTRIKNFIEPGANVPEFLKSEQLMHPRMGFISAALVRRSVFEKVGLFNETIKIGEDVDWMLRADQNKACACSLPDVLIRRRLHESNISNDLGQGHKNLAQILLNKIKNK